MSRATLTRLRRLEVKARQDSSIQNLTDAQLFGAYRDLIERGGGDDAFSAALETEGEEGLARSVHALATCRTQEAFMSVGCDG
jgi:hypothetical protein